MTEPESKPPRDPIAEAMFAARAEAGQRPITLDDLIYFVGLEAIDIDGAQERLLKTKDRRLPSVDELFRARVFDQTRRLIETIKSQAQSRGQTKVGGIDVGKATA
jgi:hypothetical protein